jgi:hypothetical protein
MADIEGERVNNNHLGNLEEEEVIPRRPSWGTRLKKVLRNSVGPASLLGILGSFYYLLYKDYSPYWEQAPVPYHWFLAAQTTLMTL